MNEKILAIGQWYTKRDCPANPKKQHWFKNYEIKYSQNPGERLVTSKCQWCGAMIKDCPTFSI